MCDFLKNAQILSAIPKLWKTNIDNVLEFELTDMPYLQLSCPKNIFRNFHDLILPKYCLLPMNRQVEWEKELNKSNNNWKIIFIDNIKTIKDIECQYFYIKSDIIC